MSDLEKFDRPGAERVIRFVLEHRGGSDSDSDGVKTIDVTPTFRGLVQSFCYLLQHGEGDGQTMARDWLLSVGDALDRLEVGEPVSITRKGATFTAARVSDGAR